MTQSIQDGLGRLFEQIVTLAKGFSKKNYEEKFEEVYREFGPVIEQLALECENAENREEAVEEAARILPDMMHTMLNQESSKRKKESLLMDYNLGMVTFVIPIFRYRKKEICEKIVDRMVELWNDNGISMDISKSTFEQIKSGFKTRLCYVTTAVCRSLGKTDDCYELNLIRNYRDEYLVRQEGGEELVKEYYNIAPTIVKRIDRMENSREIYQDIWEQYLSPCVSLIESDRKEDCRAVYTDMVHLLRKKYMDS